MRPVLRFTNPKLPSSPQERELLRLFRLCDQERRDRLLWSAETAASCAVWQREDPEGYAQETADLRAEIGLARRCVMTRYESLRLGHLIDLADEVLEPSEQPNVSIGKHLPPVMEATAEEEIAAARRWKSDMTRAARLLPGDGRMKGRA